MFVEVVFVVAVVIGIVFWQHRDLLGMKAGRQTGALRDDVNGIEWESDATVVVSTIFQSTPIWEQIRLNLASITNCEAVVGGGLFSNEDTQLNLLQVCYHHLTG